MIHKADPALDGFEDFAIRNLANLTCGIGSLNNCEPTWPCTSNPTGCPRLGELQSAIGNTAASLGIATVSSHHGSSGRAHAFVRKHSIRNLLARELLQN
jgi:hypothetical protein